MMPAFDDDEVERDCSDDLRFPHLSHFIFSYDILCLERNCQISVKLETGPALKMGVCGEQTSEGANPNTFTLGQLPFFSVRVT
jgi:hypothetical protein